MGDKTISFAHFPSIEGFHNVVRYVKTYRDACKDPILYRGKIKLHGTNAGIRIQDGEVAAQSRTQIITPASDNAGFARWVSESVEYWKNLPDCTVYGEWCGPGIMKGTAINQIPTKVFAVFAIHQGESFISEPKDIEKILGERPKDVHVLPWYGDEAFLVDYYNEAMVRKTVEKLNGVVENIEPCDPWVKSVFGIEGTAEGIVYYPQTTDREMFSNFAFKAKGEKHRVVKVKQAVQIDAEVAASIEEFVKMFLTEARMEQGLEAGGGSLEMKNISPFMKWVSNDVIKESVAELEAAGLTWEQVQKAVFTYARNWFIQKSRAL